MNIEEKLYRLITDLQKSFGPIDGKMDDWIAGYDAALLSVIGDLEEILDLNKPLPNGLCGSKESHEAHEHTSKTLGTFWCTGKEN